VLSVEMANVRDLCNIRLQPLLEQEIELVNVGGFMQKQWKSQPCHETSCLRGCTPLPHTGSTHSRGPHLGNDVVVDTISIQNLRSRLTQKHAHALVI
jgi:hypothetical protein